MERSRPLETWRRMVPGIVAEKDRGIVVSALVDAQRDIGRLAAEIERLRAELAQRDTARGVASARDLDVSSLNSPAVALAAGGFFQQPAGDT